MQLAAFVLLGIAYKSSRGTCAETEDATGL